MYKQFNSFDDIITVPEIIFCVLTDLYSSIVLLFKGRFRNILLDYEFRIFSELQILLKLSKNS